MNIESKITDEVVKHEFYRSTEKFHVIACWVGLILNLVWFISDYFVLPEHWIDFLIFRTGVSIVSLVAVVFRNQLKITIYTCMFIVVLGISIQNSYMWSVMDLEHLHQHTFAYMVLFIGAGMLVLWEFKFSVILVIATIISNALFYKLNSSLSPSEFLINGGLLTLTVAIFGVFLIRSRYKLTYNEIRGRLILAESKKIIEEEHNIVIHQKAEIEEKNEEILGSIRYAKRIQEAILPPKDLLDDMFDDYFVYYKPRDIVSGDFYWASKVRLTPKEGEISEDYIHLIALADCTGHGVPGAFMSLIGKNILEQSSKERNVNSPAEALDYLNHRIHANLNQKGTDGPVRDGMDLAMIAINKKTSTLQFAGANNPIYFIRNKELTIYKADKQPIGALPEYTKPFTNNIIQFQKGDVVYMITDGFADQFGGPNSKKFKYKTLQDLLISLSEKSMDAHKLALDKTFMDWKGNLEQVDDVSIIGIRL